MQRALIVLATTTLLAGCGSQQAGYQITDNKHSLSITRTQDYPMARWDTRLVISNFPDCQRRYTLKDTGDKVGIDLYRTEPGLFILNQGKRWYVAASAGCRMQMFEEAPPEPGELIGRFETKDDVLVYTSLEKPAAADKGTDDKAAD